MNEITHELLLSLGFVELPNRPTRYSYKGVTGRLQAENGSFHFHGFSPHITAAMDLKYMLMLIDFNQEATFTPYPSNMN